MPTFYSIGFFGIPNIGDELLSAMVVEALEYEHPGCTMYLMTRSARVSADYTGLHCNYVEGYAPDINYLLNLPSHLRAVSRSDLILIGGGGLIADHYSWASVIRYFVDVCWGILLSRPYVFVGVGVVGIRRRWLRPFVRFICRHARAVYCRDDKSAERFAVLGGRTDVMVGPDLGNLAVERSIKPCETRAYALVNFREKPPIEDHRIDEFCRTLLEHTGEIVLLAAEQPDVDYYRRVVARWPTEEQTATHIVDPASLVEAIDWIRQARVVAAARLHVNVLAAHAQRPLLTLDYEEKVGKFMSTLGAGYLSCSLDQIDAEQARRLMVLDRPNWTECLRGLAETARRSFSDTIRSGLTGTRYTLSTKVAALFHLLFALSLSMCWGMLVTVKRAFFGRGPIRGIPFVRRQ